MKNLEHTEIKKKVLLCNAEGNLNPEAAGWSRFPLQIGNLSGHFLRKKKWNYWCITSDKYMFSVTLSTLDYAGLAFVYYMDFETNQFEEDTLIVPLGTGIELGEQVHNTAQYSGKKVAMKFTQTGNQIQLSANWKDFHGRALSCDITVTVPHQHETLNVVVPWSNTQFQYTSKQHSLPAEGYFQVGEKKYFFHPQNSFACLDFGRGIWPYAISWNWGAFTAKSNEHTIGFNMGDKWTDGTGITENSVCIDGKLYKIQEELNLDYDPNNFMKPWIVTGKLSDSVQLTFTPFYERVAKSNLLIIQSEVHQCFGKYSGTIKADGNIYQITDAIGWAEEHKARW